MWVLLSIALVILAFAVFCLIPYSPSGAAYRRTVSEKIAGEPQSPELFSEIEIQGLPIAVQRYFQYCGYIDTPKMSYMKGALKDVAFVMSESRTIRIDYQQLNIVSRPERYAFISSSLAGIPFEGLDYYENGKGSMRGVLAKIVPLFNQRGEMMDQSCLVTWLSECLLLPNAALQDFVVWEAIDDTSAKATVSWNDVSASGIFSFSEAGELLSFRTSDRTAVDMKGNQTQADWSAYFSDYRAVNGVLQPRVIQSVWHYAEGDCVYFNQNESPLTIAYQ